MPFEIVRNDITRMQVDAIVNAANPSLLGGGGVDGAIHAAAGPELLEECRTLNGCRTGQAKMTKGYRLPCRFVIHTVGPVWQGGMNGEADLLASCYRESLRLAEDAGCESVAFPLISSGVYGYPKDQAMEIATGVIRDFLAGHDMQVFLVIYDRGSFAISRKLYTEIREFIDDAYVGPDYEKMEFRRKSWNVSVQEAIPTCGAPDSALKAQTGAKAEAKRRWSILTPRKKEKETRPKPSMSIEADTAECLSMPEDLDSFVRQIDEGFRDMLLRKIDERGITDAECYKRANIDRKLFSKIRNVPDYRPGKSTVLAFAVALELPLEETREMLMKAGFSLSHSSKADLIVEYFIRHGNYDIYQINEALFEFDQKLLGSLS